MEKRIILLLAGSVLLFTGSADAAVMYSFQTLNNNADVTFNQLLSINNAGVIAGYFGSGLANATPPPFTLHPNKGYTLTPPYAQANYTNENFPLSSQTQVTGINNAGVTVGFYADSNGATTPNFFGFVDQGNVFTSVMDPNTPVTGPTTNQLLGLNDNNIAAGFYVDGMGNSQGYLYNIGNKSFTPVVLPAADNAMSTTATDVNNAGMISGFFTNTAGQTEGFVDNSGTFTIFQAPGSMNTMFLGLNNKGLVVGVYADAQDMMHGLTFDLTTLSFQSVDDPNGIGTTTFNGVNDNGQIVGFYVDGNMNTDGLLASTPEPGSLVLGGLSLLAAGLCRIMRRLGKVI